ncbi:MAG: hypothetical protein K2R98_21605 [Gemmataceae bacterium]|nr:hypothetical protein [Gemmataceae bacterium]
MNRWLILVLALGFLGLSSGEAAAQKKKKEVDAAIAALADKDPKKRAEAAQQLQRIGEVRASDARPATEALVKALKSDADGNVRVAAGNALRVVEADPKLVLPTVFEVLKDLNQPNGVLAVTALLAAEFGGMAKEAVESLKAIQARENAKDEKQRDGNLLQAVNTALQYVTK